MNVQVLDQVETTATGLRTPAPDNRARRRAVAFMAAGSLVLAGSVLLATVAIRGGARPGTPVVATAAAPVAAEADGAGRFPDVGIAADTYQPGHSSGWHVHPGVHSVVVLDGRLTIYGADCSRSEYGPGDTYLGGREAHLVRNESGEPVQLAVTFVFAGASALDHATIVPAPPGCNPA